MERRIPGDRATPAAVVAVVLEAILLVVTAGLILSGNAQPWAVPTAVGVAISLAAVVGSG